MAPRPEMPSVCSVLYHSVIRVSPRFNWRKLMGGIKAWIKRFLVFRNLSCDIVFKLDLIWFDKGMIILVRIMKH